MTMQKQDEVYRGYRIIAALVSGEPKGQVYAGKDRVGGIRFEAESIDEVVAQAKSWIDARLGAARQAQRAPNIATAERYAEFLTSEKLGDHERAMLIAHANAEVLTATELSKAAGWDSGSGAANIHYGYLGRRVATLLGLELAVRADGSPIFTTALAAGAKQNADSDDNNFRWAIHPELVAGMKIAGLI
ncbi:hypothetical protein [Maricaulis sp.]|uniref:hypothetical protein n=1 Tax=Maricaulis sp. TaxID=1486257 RepID=UPI003A94B0CB